MTSGWSMKAMIRIAPPHWGQSRGATSYTCLGGVSACANTDGIPPGGPRFASRTNLQYSTRGGDKPRLTNAEQQQAKGEGWWGTPVRYTVDELE